MSIRQAHTIEDLARLARRRLPAVIADFLEGGAESEWTLGRNRTSFDKIGLQPAMLAGHHDHSLQTTLFGHAIDTPFLIGPTGLNGIFWPDADLALARAAAARNTGFVLSTPASNSIEEVGAATSSLKLFQLYCWDQRPLWARLIARARKAGYHGLIVTVDAPINGRRERDLRHGFAMDVRISWKTILDGLAHPRWLSSVWLARGMPIMANIAEFAAPGASARQITEYAAARRNTSVSWADMAWIRQQWQGPLLIKGILSCADAQQALAVGADGIVVSNHGGRQLDGVPASIDVLAGIADSVGSKMTILIDSGFRRGSDIVKALALGADAVLLGRATLYGVSAAGQAGVERALDILRDEMRVVMTLLGCQSVANCGLQHISQHV